MNKLRILYISFNMPWQGGGTFYRIMGFARELIRRGHQVTILATGPHQKWRFTKEEIDGVTLVLAPALLFGMLRTGWDPYEVFRRCRWLRARHFDLIHGFESRPVVIYPALYAQRHHRTPIILDWCDWFGRGGSVEERPWLIRLFLRPIETFFEERFRHHARGTTVINTQLKKRAIDLGIDEETIHWLPNGANVDRIRMMDRDTARRHLRLEPESLLIGHLGQAFIGDAKLMADAFARVHEKLPHSHLLLIGNHKTDIAHYVDTPDAVIETGFLDEEQLNLYLATCDLFWLPLKNTLANRGRFPMKINDYMSSGRAIVATDVGDLHDLFQQPNPVGMLAMDTPEEFAAKTISLLEDSPSRQVYGHNGRLLTETKFAWPLITANLERFYYRVIGHN